MNYLAHFYLSGNNDKIKIGNFIADYVKGKQSDNYPDLIRKGIIIHRSIDEFTDRHPLVRCGKERIKPICGRYSGVILDIFYDYLLASQWDNYSNIPLHTYTRRIYLLLLRRYFILPIRVKQFLPFFVFNRRLDTYTRLEGIRNSIEILSYRRSLPSGLSSSVLLLEEQEDFFKKEFNDFFSEIVHYVNQRFGLEIVVKRKLS